MATRAVAQHQVDIAQCECRNPAQFVRPQHRAVADDELRLGEDLVQQAPVRLLTLRHVEARDEEPPVDGTAHAQRRAIDVELVEFETQHRLG